MPLFIDDVGAIGRKGTEFGEEVLRTTLLGPVVPVTDGASDPIEPSRKGTSARIILMPLDESSNHRLLSEVLVVLSRSSPSENVATCIVRQVICPLEILYWKLKFW